MKATKRIKNAVKWGLSTLTLASVMLFSVACTRGGNTTPHDTTGGTSAVTSPATGNHGTGTGTNRPLDPDAGTVAPDGAPGDPPAGTESGTSRSHFPRMMH